MTAICIDPNTFRVKSHAEIVEQELIKIRAERIEKQSESDTQAAFALARQRGIDRATSSYATNITTPVAVVNSAPPAKQSKRRNLLTPLIETAQRDTGEPFDTPAIWANLCTMAEQKIKPLLGQSEDGIKWLDGEDNAQFLTLKMLRDRLGRQKKAAQKRAKTPLSSVK